MPRAALTLFALLVALSSLAACGHAPAPMSPAPPPGLTSPFTGYRSAHYADPRTWLCLPGRHDACAKDLDATELLPDGSRIVVRDAPPAEPPKVDCFYVYPTVDMRLGPANHEDFDDLEPMERATVAQAARFRTTCRLFVPLYRQVTIGTYFKSPEEREPWFRVAESDVVDAFLHYMGQMNQGRKVVLIGHSQGADMVARLMKKIFDADPVMRERLLIAFSIGGWIETAPGRTTGGSFDNIPVCTRKGETGCVVGYRSFVAGTDVSPGQWAPHVGKESVCVDPAELLAGVTAGASPRLFSRTFIPVTNAKSHLEGVDDVTTPFVLLRNFYSGQCLRTASGFSYLAVSATPAPGDERVSPIDLSSHWMHTRMGLHILDYQFAQGDLVDLVAERAAAIR